LGTWNEDAVETLGRFAVVAIAATEGALGSILQKSISAKKFPINFHLIEKYRFEAIVTMYIFTLKNQ
jgi:hypothetical protein